MEKVNEIPSSPLDFFLLPVWVHKRLSIGLNGLILAFLFVGTFDLVFLDNIFKARLFNGSFAELAFKLALFAALALVIGAIDVACTMVPIADFAAMIGKRSEKYVSGKMQIILMKSYALSHLLVVIPYAIYLYSGISWENVGVLSPSRDRLLLSIILTLIPILKYVQLGIIYRTISVRTRIQVFGKLILIMAAYFWMEISGNAVFFIEALAYQFMKSIP